jgi:hypothetical protein
MRIVKLPVVFYKAMISQWGVCNSSFGSGIPLT